MVTLSPATAVIVSPAVSPARLAAEPLTTPPMVTPPAYPLDGLDEAIGFRSKRVPLAFLLGGIAGAALGFGMQVWLNYLFPLWIGGRPLVAVPGYMMITFELMVLCSVLSGVATMLLSNRLPKLHHPVFDFERFDLSAERFYLAILAGPDFDRDEAGKALAGLDPVAIGDVAEQPA